MVARTLSESWSAFAPGAWKIADRHRRLVVEQAAQRVVRGAELDARDVAQARDGAVLARP